MSSRPGQSISLTFLLLSLMTGGWLGSRAAADEPTAAPKPTAKPVAKAKKITPAHVFARVELVKRKLDVLLSHRGISPESIPKIVLREKAMKPMHIYQLHLTCLDQIRKFEQGQKVIPTPLIVAYPNEYGPGDVLQLSILLSERVDRVAKLLGVPELPQELTPVQKKSPLHVYQQIVPVLSKLMALNQTNKVTPSEVFSQMVRVRQDAQSIISAVAMSQTGDKRRQLQAKAFGMSVDGQNLELDQSISRTPADAYEACMLVRKTINQVWVSQNRPPLPLPTRQAGEKIAAADVYLQTQVVIAELNLLKLISGTTAPTPPTNQSTAKTPAHVRGEALWTKFILSALVAEFQEAA